MAPRKSPRDAMCPHCKRKFTKGGLRQHLKHVKCSPTSTATPRKFQRVRCKHCLKSFHSTNSLRVHVSTTHPKEYSRAPGHMKHHRVPYSMKKRSSDITGKEASRFDGRASSHPSMRYSSHAERQSSRHSADKQSSRKSGDVRLAAEPAAWQSALAKEMAAAAKRT